MNGIEDELTRRFQTMNPEAPDTDDWGAAARRRSAHTRRTRAVTIGAAALVAAVAVLVPSLVGGADRAATDDPATNPSESGTAPSPRPTWDEDVPKVPRSGSLRTPRGNMVGVWEDGDIVGDVEVFGTVAGYERVLYAARRPFEDPKNGETVRSTYVALGLRDGSRILQLNAVLSAKTVAKKGWDLYGGNRGDVVTGTTGYLVVGAVRGEADLSIGPEGGPMYEVTLSTPTILPGSTVFLSMGPWESGWDDVQLAPLFVQGSGLERPLSVRRDSWTG